MPSEFTQYVLVGFCVELDWRTLTFIKSIPEFRVCGACGIVRKKTAILSCKHVLCESCYDQSAQDEAMVCPIDGHPTEGHDVVLMEFDSAELLDREVKCWNEERGCGAVLPASKIAQHFQTECGHHTVSCRKCSATVLCSEVYAHLRSEYCPSVAPASAEQGCDSTRKVQMALLTSAMETSERCTNETKAVPDMQFAHSSAHAHPVSELSKTVKQCNESLRQELHRGINSIRETIRQVVGQVKREQRAERECLNAITAFGDETRDGEISSNDRMMRLKTIGNDLVKEAKGQSEVINHISEGVEEVKGLVKESKEKIDLVGKMLRNSNVQKSSCEFSITGVKSLREEALKNDEADYEADIVCLLGYCLFPGVYFKNQSGTITLHSMIRLRPGDMDDDLQWPFTKRVKLRVMHPVRRDCLEINEAAYPEIPGNEKPLESSDSAFVSSSYLHLDEMLSEGFVKDDEIRVEFQLQS
ncbi:TNF receptor-associated factor 4-like [Amblyomma americanum]